MPYKVAFVGVIDFFRMETEEPLLLLPDGRNPGRRIDEHFAAVWVHQDQVEDAGGWWPLVEQDAQLAEQGVVELRIMEPCYISITGQEAGRIDTRGFAARVPILKEREPNIQIDPRKAETIAQIPLRNGTLTALKLHGTSMIGDLNVPDHEGPIRITATPSSKKGRFQDGTAEKVLVLKDLPVEDEDGLDRFFVANFSNEDVNTTDPEADHFQIYRKLDSGGKVGRLKTPSDDEILAIEADSFFSTHPFGLHLQGFGAVGGGQCSVTGCCRP